MIATVTGVVPFVSMFRTQNPERERGADDVGSGARTCPRQRVVPVRDGSGRFSRAFDTQSHLWIREIAFQLLEILPHMHAIHQCVVHLD